MCNVKSILSEKQVKWSLHVESKGGVIDVYTGIARFTTHAHLSSVESLNSDLNELRGQGFIPEFAIVQTTNHTEIWWLAKTQSVRELERFIKNHVDGNSIVLAAQLYSVTEIKNP